MTTPSGVGTRLRFRVRAAAPRLARRVAGGASCCRRGWRGWHAPAGAPHGCASSGRPGGNASFRPPCSRWPCTARSFIRGRRRRCAAWSGARWRPQGSGRLGSPLRTRSSCLRRAPRPPSCSARHPSCALRGRSGRWVTGVPIAPPCGRLRTPLPGGRSPRCSRWSPGRPPPAGGPLAALVAGLSALGLRWVRPTVLLAESGVELDLGRVSPAAVRRFLIREYDRRRLQSLVLELRQRHRSATRIFCPIRNAYRR